MSAFRTIVALLTPEAEPFVGELRQRHTPGGERGMTGHVTLLAPFVDADAFNSQIADRLSRAIEGFSAFDLWLSKVERFDPGVLYLSVEPIERARALIGRICDAFPDYKPYGVYTADTVIPHHTLATAEGFPNGPTQKDLDVFTEVEAEVADALPIKCRAKDIAVMSDGPDGWSVAWESALR